VAVTFPHAPSVANMDSVQTIAVKIFSVLVNSMPDERSGSKITWFNSLLRSRQSVQTLTDMVQIGQWYGSHVHAVCF
jgi:hypothetical protein